MSKPYEGLGILGERFALKVTHEIEVTREDIDDIMCSALEGGICCWCDAAEIVGEYLGEYAHEQISWGGTLRLHDYEDDVEHELTRDKFMQGLKMFLENGNGDLVNIKNRRIDPCEIDGECADSIIQYAVFGELVYG